MKYNWRLMYLESHDRLLVSFGYTPGYRKYYYKRLFDEKDIQFLSFLLQELTYCPKGMEQHKIAKVQHRLGNAVWDKLGERNGNLEQE